MMAVYKIVLSVWIFCFALIHCNCQTTTLTPAVADVIEGRDVTLVCKVSTAVMYTAWTLNTTAGTPYMVYLDETCSVNGFLGNESDKYSYACNSTVFQVKIHGVQRSQHNNKWTCRAQGQSIESASVIQIKVPIASVTITPSTSTVNIEEYHSKQFTCITSEGRPAGSVSWYKIKSDVKFQITQNTTETQTTNDNGFIVTTSVLNFVLTRELNGIKVCCEAGNTANSNNVKSSEKQLNVLYESLGPTIAEGNVYRVLENVQGELNCRIEGGNPTPSVTWNCNNWSSGVSQVGETITNTLSWTTARGQDHTCTCISQQPGFPNKSISINVIIHYPPSTPTFKVNGHTISGPIRFIEGKARSIQCVTESNPTPKRYTWTNAQSSPVNGQYRTFNSVQRSNAGQYSCEVQNTMNPSNGEPITGTNISSMALHVLYPPKIGIISDMDIEEGTPLNKRCQFTPGNPPNTTAKWTRNIDNKIWNTEVLIIPSVSRSDEAYYKCEIYNVMEPTAETTISEEKVTGTFHLNVQYQAVVTSFYVIGFETNTGVTTVTETYPLQFNCTVISNHFPTIQIRKGDNTLNSSTGSLNMLHSIGNAMCLDAGTYTCFGINKVNKGENASRQLQVNVNCSPRSADTVNLNRTSETNETFTFTFNAIAHPVPVFIWKKWVGDVWKRMQDDDNVRITSFDLQSNLTIHRVGRGDFGKYLLVVSNDFGEMEFHYQIEPCDQPSAPTDFLEHMQTESSIQLEWKPGFNGGPPQTFYIKYKKSSSSTWNYVSASDTGQQTMQYTLTGLESDTQYHIIIYSSNRKGNSSESEPLIAKTNALLGSANPASLIGGVIGGIAICFVIAIMTFIIVRHYRSRKGKPNSAAENPTSNQYETNKSSDDVSYYNIGREVHVQSQSNSEATYYNEGSVPDYEALNKQNMDVTTYSSLQPKNSRQTNDNTDIELRVYENLQLGVI